ncbi:MAG: UDP-glucuronic acid decarboxylase family protein [Streptosporangiaceae bacterium]
MKASTRRVVLTGGAGFLGSHLCERLLGSCAGVVCLDNFVTSSAGNMAHLLGRPGFQLTEYDVTRPLHVPGDVDLVLHFASAASPVDYLRLPVETLEVGAAGTQHALDLARDKGARFVLASTSEVYGDPQQHPQAEDYWGNVNPVGPRSVYDEAKRYAEALTTAYRNSREVDTAIVRIFNTYGPRMRPHDGRAIPTFIRQALAGAPLTIAGDGSQTRSVCYVDDTVTGILALAASDFAGPVNIGSSQELTVLQLAETIRDLAGSTSPIEFITRPVDDPAVRRPDITLAHRRLGWRPAITLEEGLRRTIDWFASQSGSQAAALLVPDYTRIGPSVSQTERRPGPGV